MRTIGKQRVALWMVFFFLFSLTGCGGHRRKHGIPCLVPVGVVELFEMIDVDHEKDVSQAVFLDIRIVDKPLITSGIVNNKIFPCFMHI